MLENNLLNKSKNIESKEEGANGVDDLPKDFIIPEIQWQERESIQYHYNIRWYWSISIAALILIVASILLKNYSFIAVVILGAYLLIFFSKKEPSIVDFGISGEGIKIGKKVYLFADFDWFAVIDNPDKTSRLILKKKRGFIPDIELPLPKESDKINEIRNALRNFLKEEKKEESFTSIFSRLIKF